MTPIIVFLKDGTFEEAEKETMKCKCTRYTIIGEELYRRSFSRPLLKCIGKTQVEYILAELHNEICGLSFEGRSMATRALRDGYYWPSMGKDSIEYIKRCQKS